MWWRVLQDHGVLVGLGRHLVEVWRLVDLSTTKNWLLILSVRHHVSGVNDLDWRKSFDHSGVYKILCGCLVALDELAIRHEHVGWQI